MIQFLDGLPADVIAIEAVGKVTHADYRDTLIPRAEAVLASGPARMMYVIGTECTGFELGALWDDGSFGVRHWNDFTRIAVVSDHGWVRGAVALFRPLFPCDVRLFGTGTLADARRWIAEPAAVNAS